MLRSVCFALAVVIVGLMSTAASAQPFRDRGYHADRHYHRYHPHFYRHGPFRRDDHRR